MNGWQRLSVVIGGGITALAGYIGYNSDTGAFYSHYPSRETSALRDSAPDQYWPAVWNEINWRNNPELERCQESTIRGNQYLASGPVYVTCDHPAGLMRENAAQYAFKTAAILFAIYLILGWIVAGFRRSKT